MLNVLNDGRHLGNQFITLGGEQPGSLGEVFREELALRIIGQKPCQFAIFGFQHRCGRAEVIHFRLAQPVTDDRSRDTDAVEDIADVVKDAGSDLGHAGLARDLE